MTNETLVLVSESAIQHAANQLSAYIHERAGDELRAACRPYPKVEQEPVAWMYDVYYEQRFMTQKGIAETLIANGEKLTPLYTTPPSTAAQDARIAELEAKLRGAEVWCLEQAFLSGTRAIACKWDERAASIRALLTPAKIGESERIIEVENALREDDQPSHGNG